jgi:hypothetical protein
MRPKVNGRSNAEVLRPLRSARELTTRPREAWIVDFGRRGQEEAQLFEAPFAHVEQHVRPQRVAHRDRSRRERWWLHGRTGDELRAAVAALAHVIVTPRAGKCRSFVRTFPFPASLAQAHATLDAAVAAAYGWADWSAATSDEEIPRRPLALNRERATV